MIADGEYCWIGVVYVFCGLSGTETGKDMQTSRHMNVSH